MSVVVTRGIGEAVCIGDDIVVTVVEVRAHAVRIAIACPRDVRVDRLELRIARHARDADAASTADDEEPEGAP